MGGKFQKYQVNLFQRKRRWVPPPGVPAKPPVGFVGRGGARKWMEFSPQGGNGI